MEESPDLRVRHRIRKQNIIERRAEKGDGAHGRKIS